MYVNASVYIEYVRMLHELSVNIFYQSKQLYALLRICFITKENNYNFNKYEFENSFSGLRRHYIIGKFEYNIQAPLYLYLYLSVSLIATFCYLLVIVFVL